MAMLEMFNNNITLHVYIFYNLQVFCVMRIIDHTTQSQRENQQESFVLWLEWHSMSILFWIPCLLLEQHLVQGVRGVDLKMCTVITFDR